MSSRSSTSPAQDGMAVTPSDSTDLSGGPCRAINVAASGAVSVDTIGGTESLVVYVAAGIAFPIVARRINSTGTTATGIVALY